MEETEIERVVVALAAETVDLSSPQEALVGDTAPPAQCHVVLPLLARHLKERHPNVRLLCVDPSADLQHLKAQLGTAEILFVLDLSPSLFTQVVPLMPRLRWVHSYLAGVDGLCELLREVSPQLSPSSSSSSSLLLTNARGVYSSSLKEYTLAAILHFAKGIPRLQRNKRDKKWDKFIVGELRGQTVGFVGFGDIARHTAAACKFLGMRCIALRNDASKKDDLLEAVYAAGSQEELEVYRHSDFVVCSLPATPKTINSVSSPQFAAMKKTAVFISIGRGVVVDEEALIDALQSGTIAGAALDVFGQEPLPVASPLWDAPNVLLSSHNADWCVNYSAEASIHTFEKNLNRFLNGAKTNDEMETPFDCQRGY